MKYIVTFIFFLCTQATFGKVDTLYHSLYFSVGYPFGVGSTEFFNTYEEITSSKKHNMKVTSVLEVGLKHIIGECSRVGMSASWLQSNFKDALHQKIYPKSEDSPYRYLSEEITINDMRLLCLYDYCPYLKKQFRTYISGGLGLNISNILWEEYIHSPLKWDLRTTGTRVSKIHYSILYRLALGMELGWDQKHADYLLGSLILEAAYLYDFKKIKMFTDFADQFDKVPIFTTDKVKMLPNYFTFSIAVSLNMKHYLGRTTS